MTDEKKPFRILEQDEVMANQALFQLVQVNQVSAVFEVTEFTDDNGRVLYLERHIGRGWNSGASYGLFYEEEGANEGTGRLINLGDQPNPFGYDSNVGIAKIRSIREPR